MGSETESSLAAAEETPQAGQQQDEVKKAQFPIVAPGHSRPVVDVQFSGLTEDGVFLVSGCHDKLPMLRWGDNGDWIGSFDGHKGAVWAACFNSDATRVATGSGDFSARLFDAINGDLIHTFEHKHIVKAVDISKKDDKLLTGGNDKVLRIFDLKAINYPCLANMDTKAPIRKAAWVNKGEDSFDQGIVICGCDDGSVQVWDSTKPETPVLEWKLTDPVKDLEVCPAQKTITIAAGKTVYFYDLDSFELKKHLDLGIVVEGASLNPVTGTQFICGGSTDLWVHVFDYETGKEIRSHTGHHGPIFCLRYHPEGKIYASGSEDGTVRMWKLE